MDLTFKTRKDVFNYRVCAIMINDNKLLAMNSGVTKYLYLPGGRASMHESAEEALVREIKEEMNIDVKIIRPLWLSQNFFIEDASHKKYHELCLYFLVDIKDTCLLEKGDKFVMRERHHIHHFEWIPFDELNKRYLYPLFIKNEIYNLSDTLQLRTDDEYMR